MRHPDWLHKKILEKNDNFKQRRITDMFSVSSKKVDRDSATERNQADSSLNDIEDIASDKPSPSKVPVVTVNKRKRRKDSETEFSEEELNKYWKDVLGNPPSYGTTEVYCQFSEKLVPQYQFLIRSCREHFSLLILGGASCLDQVSKKEMEVSSVTKERWSSK